MKNSILITALLSTMVFYAQKNVVRQVESLIAKKAVFKSFSIMTPVNSFQNSEYEKAVSKASLATINFAAVNEIVSKKPETIELEIPYHNDIITVQLFKANLLADGFHIDTDKSKNEAYNAGVYYRGMIKEDENSIVSFNFFNDEMNGIISNALLSNLVIGKLKKDGNTQDYIIYEDQNLKIPSNFECQTSDLNVKGNLDSHRDGNETESTASVKCVSMYFEIDNDIFIQNGSNVVQTSNWMIGLFNNIQTLYANDNINIALKSIYIWTTQDPYTGSTSQDYRDYFGAVRPNFDGDVGSLIGIDPGGLGGIAATIGGLCSPNNYSYSDVDLSYDTVPIYSWTVNVISHENGHVLGSRHTHACVWNGNNTAIDGCAGFQEGGCPAGPIPSPAVKGTQMSYCHLVNNVGISFTNGFGPQPSAAILNYVNSSGCLTSNCFGAICTNNISSIDVAQDSSTTAQVTWADSNAAQWVVSVFPLSSQNAIFESVNIMSYTAINLTEGVTYKVKIRPICSQNLLTFYSEYDFTFGGLMGIKDNNPLDFKFYPNPTKDYINIKANSQIDEVFVYNIEGRLLYQAKVDTLDTTVNMSAFASGTYFFKIKSADKEANFKVLKF